MQIFEKKDVKALLVGIISMTLLFSIFTLTETFAAKSTETDSVYLIKTHDQGIKNSFGVRHNFDIGFTTFLNENQVAGLERAGFEIEKVPLYQLTPPCSPMPDCKKNNDGDSDDSGGPRIGEPIDRVPWGIDLMNNGKSVDPSAGENIIVAVLDSGVDISHPDLVITQCKDFTKGKNIKNSCTDDDGHGTHVIGTIAGNGGSDNLGIFGVAPKATIYAYKVCGGSGCWTDDIAAAINHAGVQGAHIVSMSLGGDSESTLIKNAINDNLGILFIAAAGNDGPEIGTIDYPAANPNVMAVAAINENEVVAGFSSRGIDNFVDTDIIEKEIEVGAPGVDVESTCTGSFDGAYFDLDGEVNGYCIISGTSMATPHVSGMAAKLWKDDASSTRTYLQEIATDHDLDVSGYDVASGYGLPQTPP